MKRIESIIKPFKLDEVMAALTEAGVTGLTVIEAQGFGRQKGHTEIYRGSEYRVDFIPKVELEITANDQLADAALNAILKSAETGQVGDGKIFISRLDDAMRIRTGEKGDKAI